MNAFQNLAFQSTQLKSQQAQKKATFPQMPQTYTPHWAATSSHAASSSCPQTQHQPSNPEVKSPDHTRQSPSSPFGLPTRAGLLDPTYIAMVSRIAAYYQQRCQAISNHQQQRCQAWVSMHRQKCQEMVQAAMLVVAWYIRDRIQRRRRRQKSHFRSGLKERCGRSKVTKGEVVRRWVLQVPEAALSPNESNANWPIDKEEANFEIDAEIPIEKDAKLFNVADNLIKSQLAKIEVPLIGAISFESESESESEREQEQREDDNDDNDDDDDDDEEEEEEEEDEEAKEEQEQDILEGFPGLKEVDELYEDECISFDDSEEFESSLSQGKTGNRSQSKENSSVS